MAYVPRLLAFNGYLVLAVALAVSSGCSGSDSASCETVDDCFSGEACRDGSCQILEANQSPENVDDVGQNNGNNEGGNSVDSGGTANTVANDSSDTGNGDHENSNGEYDGGENDSGNGEPEHCARQAGCDRMVDEDVLHPGVHIGPEIEGDIENYGCPEELDEIEFLGGVHEPIEAHFCSDDKHYYRIRTEQCGDRGFTIDVSITTRDEMCPVDDLINLIVRISGSGSSPECDELTTDRCVTVEEAPPGELRWKIHFEAEYHNPKYLPTDLVIEPIDEKSFPYELSVEVSEVGGD